MKTTTDLLKMKNILYINDLRKLPNYGCRTTGRALEELLRKQNTVLRRDGLETVLNSGWDFYAVNPFYCGGVVPSSLYHFFWQMRHKIAYPYLTIKRINRLFGREDDYIADCPFESVKRYFKFLKYSQELQSLENDFELSDAVVINGEGTLILGNPMNRDARYLLFILALSLLKQKPVYLLNAMITECPFTGCSITAKKQTAELLSSCKVIACREKESLDYVNGLIGSDKTKLIPDALFTWKERFLRAAAAIKSDPSLAITFRSNLEFSDPILDKPYICVSSSSSAHRFGVTVPKQMVKLAKALSGLGCRVIFIATCAGDQHLENAAREANVAYLPPDLPVMAGAGILAGALVYVTGRYHPAIMAAAGGVPTIFLGSNSHKTRSVQKLLNYDKCIEFPICLSDSDINAIVDLAINYISNRNVISKKVSEAVDKRSREALAFSKIID